MRVAIAVRLTDEQIAKLLQYARGRLIAKRVVERARIVLQAAEGKQDREIAAEVGVGRHIVARWRARFLQKRCGRDRKGCAATRQSAPD